MQYADSGSSPFQLSRNISIAGDHHYYNVRAPKANGFRAEAPTLMVKKTFTGAEPKRLIFIGDIHGSVKEFNRLLCTAKFKKDQDQVILVGDLVAKGPDSVAVVRRANQINAWAVRGNHDDRVIRWYEFLAGPGKGLSESELKSMESSGGLPYADFKLGKDHYTIATQLTPEDFAFLKTFPTIISLPPPYTNWIVVHGGLDPSKPLMQQSAEDIMITRNIDSSGPTSETKSGSAWFELWATKMATLTQGGNSPTGGADIDFSKIQFEKVIYGHDAGRALQLHPLTKGLDSRCVYGGALTAFVLPGETTFSVTCPDYDGSVKDD